MMNTDEPQKKDTPLLFGLLIKKFTTDGKAYVHFNWGKIALLLVTTIAFMWMSVATLLFAYFKYAKDFDTVKFSNMVLLPSSTPNTKLKWVIGILNKD